MSTLLGISCDLGHNTNNINNALQFHANVDTITVTDAQIGRNISLVFTTKKKLRDIIEELRISKFKKFKISKT